jgi:hypothetical protein
MNLNSSHRLVVTPDWYVETALGSSLLPVKAQFILSGAGAGAGGCRYVSQIMSETNARNISISILGNGKGCYSLP